MAEFFLALKKILNMTGNLGVCFVEYKQNTVELASFRYTRA